MTDLLKLLREIMDSLQFWVEVFVNLLVIGLFLGLIALFRYLAKKTFEPPEH